MVYKYVFLFQCDVDGDVEYEFPCYNYTEALEGLWSPEDARYREGGIYGGVLLKTAASTPLSNTNPSIGTSWFYHYYCQYELFLDM